MTLDEIVKQALSHLEYGTDDEALSVFFERFSIYANEAIQMIAHDLRMTHTEEVELVGGSFNVFSLSKECVKVVDVTSDGGSVEFVNGNDFGEISVSANGTVSVTYRFIPDPVMNGNDIPDIPVPFHKIIYLYIVHCHHNTRSSSSDYDRTKWYQQFLQQKHRLVRRGYAALNNFKFSKMPWETGEF